MEDNNLKFHELCYGPVNTEAQNLGPVALDHVVKRLHSGPALIKVQWTWSFGSLYLPLKNQLPFQIPQQNWKFQPDYQIPP